MANTLSSRIGPFQEKRAIRKSRSTPAIPPSIWRSLEMFNHNTIS